MTWATTTESANAANTANLPAFAWTYVPDANGAAGGYYPDGNVTPYSPVEIYGAKQPARDDHDVEHERLDMTTTETEIAR